MSLFACIAALEKRIHQLVVFIVGVAIISALIITTLVIMILRMQHLPSIIRFVFIKRDVSILTHIAILVKLTRNYFVYVRSTG